MEITPQMFTQLGELSAFLIILLLVYLKLNNSDKTRDEKIEDFGKQLTEIKLELTKLSTWREIITSMDAIQSAQTAKRQGLTAKHSPEAPTEKWFQLITNGTNDRIENFIANQVINESPYVAAFNTYAEFEDTLIKVAKDTDTDIKAIYGVIQVLCERASEKVMR